MNIEKALLITKDRIENMKLFIPSNPSEVRIKEETVEWLDFIEKILEEEIKKYVDEYNRETIKTRIHYTVYSLQSSIEQYEIEIKKQTKMLTEIEKQIAKLEPLCKELEDRG